ISKMTTEELLPGTIQLLEELKDKGIKMALGSASKNSALILERTGIRDFFDAIVDGNSVTTSKPDPEVFLKAAELLQAAPTECIVFEDAEAGVAAAIAAQMLVVGIGSKATLPDADLIIKDLSEIDLSGIMKLKNN
ncbi:predicted phosphatase/phosphohexomutase, partial [Pedobacter sp. BAL39]|uniref:HAD-IA family hydrolase n=1 Tax=Pedobacter sp. BAL39 TaxID=391596 RepID=UPI000155A926